MKETLVLKAFDKDTVSSDELGFTKPIPLSSFIEYEGIQNYHVPLLDEKDKKIGEIKLSSKLNWVEYIPPIPHKLIND